MLAAIASNKSPCQKVFQTRSTNKSERAKAIAAPVSLMMQGDLLFRKAGVVATRATWRWSTTTTARTASRSSTAPSPGKPASHRPLTYAFISTNYTDCWRPMLGNADTPGNRQGGG